MKLDMYEAIGGRNKLNAAVRIFYRKVMADPNLQPFFAKTDMNGLRAKQVMFLSMLLGNTESFGRPDIRAAHTASRHEGLTDAHVDAFFGHFRSTLEDIGVQPEIVEQIMHELESTRREVLDRPT